MTVITLLCRVFQCEIELQLSGRLIIFLSSLPRTACVSRYCGPGNTAPSLKDRYIFIHTVHTPYTVSHCGLVAHDYGPVLAPEPGVGSHWHTLQRKYIWFWGLLGEGQSNLLAQYRVDVGQNFRIGHRKNNYSPSDLIPKRKCWA